MKWEDVTNEEYVTFYWALLKNMDDHLSAKHFRVEEFRAIIFVHWQALDDMFGTKNHIDVFVRRFFMMVTREELIPERLNFVEGIVDSEDLTHISRGTLHQHKILRVITKNSVKKCRATRTHVSEKKTE